MRIKEKIKIDKIQGFRFGSSPFGRPPFSVYTYFVDGLLIDTAHSNMRKEVMDSLSRLPVQQIFITHHHEDHSGNLIPLKAHFNCTVYASAKCVELMKDPPWISFAQRMFWGKSEATDQLIAEDQLIQTPNYQFQLIPIPGHAADMLGLYEAKQGWFFSSDLFVHNRIKFFMKTESIAQQIQSIKTVLLLDFDVLLCNHNPQLKGGKKKLQSKLKFLEDYYGKVKQLYEQQYSVSAIIEEMQLERNWPLRLLSQGNLSAANMVKSVIRDEQKRLKSSVI